MKSKVKRLLVLSVVLGLFGFVLINSYSFNLCFSDNLSKTYDVVCNQKYGKVGSPMFYGFGALSLVFLALLFKPEAITAWSKFAKWFIPIATLIFIFYPNPGAGDFFSPYPEQIFQWIGVIYVIISILLIFKFSGKN